MNAAPDRRLRERRRAGWSTQQLRRRGIADERVLAAMARVPREEFVPARLRDRAYDDAALPIGEGQTISQPYIVAAMCELLELDGRRARARRRHRAPATRPPCSTSSPRASSRSSASRSLGDRARAALERHGSRRRSRCGSGTGRLGAPDRAPFDAIAVAAATERVPPALYDQLPSAAGSSCRAGGRGGQRLVRVVRTEDGAGRDRVARAAASCRSSRTERRALTGSSDRYARPT